MDLNNLSPYIRTAMDSFITPPWKLYERVIFDYELLYIKSGEVTVTVENEIYHGKPGDIFLFKPKQKHSISIVGSEPLRQPHIHFDLFYEQNSPDVKVSFKQFEAMTESEKEMFREDITSEIINPFPSYIRLQSPLTLEKMLFSVIYEFNNRVPFYEIAVKGLFIQLWAQLLREIYWSNNTLVLTNIELLNKVKSYLDVSLNQKVTLDNLAEFAHLNKFYLSHLYKKAFGVTPIQYHLMARINKAKEEIQFTDLSMNEIAEKLGFQSIYSFSRAFKKLEKVPPSFYRR
jgi:AraC-like DNA-binding protein